MFGNLYWMPITILNLRGLKQEQMVDVDYYISSVCPFLFVLFFIYFKKVKEDLRQHIVINQFLY
jgi:hypothetical protein